jgi:hypothetical protein
MDGFLAKITKYFLSWTNKLHFEKKKEEKNHAAKLANESKTKKEHQVSESR